MNLVASGHRAPAIFELAHAALDESRTWDSNVAHLPGAESFVASAFLFALAFDPSSKVLIGAGLATPLLSVQRAALSHLSPEEDDQPKAATQLSNELRPTLVKLAVSNLEASESRIAALEILVGAPWSADDEELPALLVTLSKQHAETVIVPLREALLPLVARLADTVCRRGSSPRNGFPDPSFSTRSESQTMLTTSCV